MTPYNPAHRTQQRAKLRTINERDTERRKRQ